MAKVVLENVFKIYPGNITAVHDACLEINDQEFLILVGPSGCGKSTTLRMIAGLEEISKGSIFIDGKKVNDVPPKDRDIAMVFQNYALYPHMSVYENLAFGLKLRKFARKDIDERVREAADILGIHELLQRKPKALSGGQRQRVAVGRAIVRKPKAFLFDEPLSNLDAKMRVQMRMEISKLHTRLSSTMIYVTHDQVEAMTMGDRIVVMKDGFIQQVADPIELYNHPANQFVAGFIGSPPMNFMNGIIQRGPHGLAFNEGQFKLALGDTAGSKLASWEGKDVVMGIRPEDIEDILYAVNPPADWTIEANVDVVEPMGAEVMTYFTASKSSFVGRMREGRQSDVNQKRKLVFKMSKAHFFQPDTGRTIV